MNNFSYTYNDVGERIKKTEVDSSHTEYYLRDYLGRELVIYSYETNDPKQVNIFGNDLVGKIEIDTTETRSYYLKDHLGSVRSVVDNNSSVVSAMDYYPYGETIRQYNNNRYLLTEKERDAESGNDYFGARYYNSKLGVWLQVDPLSEKYPGWSPYNYTLNNPLRFVDPKGTEVDWTKEDLFNWLSAGNDGFPTNSSTQNSSNSNNGNQDEKQKSKEKDSSTKNVLLGSGQAVGATFAIQEKWILEHPEYFKSVKGLPLAKTAAAPLKIGGATLNGIAIGYSAYEVITAESPNQAIKGGADIVVGLIGTSFPVGTAISTWYFISTMDINYSRGPANQSFFTPDNTRVKLRFP